MTKSPKRQMGFYADDDISEYLDTLSPGVKTKTINAALRAWRDSRQSIEVPAYGDVFESLVSWLNIQRDPITVGTVAGNTLSLAALLTKFIHQHRLRPTSMTWPEVAEQGMTFPAPDEGPYAAPPQQAPLMVPFTPMNKCASCHKMFGNPADLINTPSRGAICRSCFELPFPRS